MVEISRKDKKGKPFVDYVMSTTEACRFLGISRQTLWRHTYKLLNIPYHIRKANGKPAYYKTDLISFANS